jgi:hypothetical protein
MNTKTTFIVLILAIALGVYFLKFETDTRPEPAPETETAPTGQPLFARDTVIPEKINTVRVERDGQTAVIHREASSVDDWKQIEPVKFGVQSWTMSSLLGTAASLRYTSSFTPAQKKLSLADLGLAPAKAVLTLESAAAKTVMTLGSKAAAGRAYLVLGPVSDSSTVYVVEDRLHDELLSKKPRDWRSQTLTTLTPGNARKIELTRDGVTTQLVSKDGRWTLAQPVVGRADKAAAEALVNAVGAASIDSFVEDNPKSLAAFGLDKPQIVLAIDAADLAPPLSEKKDDKAPAPPAEKITTHKLAIGAATDLQNEKSFATWDDAPVVFALRKADVEKFQKSADDLRDPRLTPVAQADVKDIALDRPADPLHFTVEQGQWSFADPKPAFNLDSGQVTKLIDALLKTRAGSYVAYHADPASAALVTVKLGVTNQPEPEVLAVRAAADPAKLMVVRGNETSGYIVDKSALAPLLDPPLAYRNRNALDLKPDDVTAIKITRTGKHPAVYDIARAAPKPEGPPAPGNKKTDAPALAKVGDWKLDGFNKEAIGSLFTALMPLRADKWLDAPAAAPSPEDSVVIDLTLADGKTTKVTLDPVKRTAAATGVDRSFEVEPATVIALASELRDTAVLKLEIDKIAAVKSGDVTVKRDAATGQYKAEGAAGLNQAKAAALFDALAGLRAVFFVESTAAAGDPVVTITVTTADKKTQTIKVWTPAGGEPVAQVGEKAFTIKPDAAAALTAKLVK